MQVVEGSLRGIFQEGSALQGFGDVEGDNRKQDILPVLRESFQKKL